MPETARSFHSVSLKVLSSAAFCGAVVEGLKSGTASRTFSTPRLVPVLTQSCAKSVEETKQQMKMRTSTHTEPRNLFGQRQELGLSTSSIRVGVKGTLYDNIVFR